MEKLENMYIVLTSENAMNFGKEIDEFEWDFQKLREEIRDVKDSINKRKIELETA